jgi:AraC family transcriptional regulator
MSNVRRSTSAIVSTPDRAACHVRDEALARLLAAAAAMFDTNPERAKVCVLEAAELLRFRLQRAGHPRIAACSGGVLAPWQERRVVAYIDSNIDVRFRVSDLAGLVKLSVSHFFRAFKLTFGQSPLVYVKVRRIRHAQAVMLNTLEPLAQVALHCGMSDQAHFSRVFRQVVGINPSLWRRQVQSEAMSADDVLRQVQHESLSV